MTLSFSTPVKYVASILLTSLLTAGVIYAVNITSLSQTANPGDAVTSTWVNAVNTATVAAAGYGQHCVAIPDRATALSTVKSLGTPTSITDLLGGGGNLISAKVDMVNIGLNDTFYNAGLYLSAGYSAVFSGVGYTANTQFCYGPR